jgi:hypothetical protein
MAQSASAQKARRGFSGFSPAEIATLSEVQADLKLKEDQQAKTRQIYDELRSERRNLWQGGGFEGDFEEMGRKIQELNQGASAKLVEVLDPPQRARLQEILIQVNGAMALNEADVVKVLNLSDEQQEKLAEIPRKIWPAIRDAVDETQTDDQRRAIIADIRAKNEEEMLAVLTPGQREEFKAMQGQPIEVDTNPLRPRGWGRRNRDRDRDRD